MLRMMRLEEDQDNLNFENNFTKSVDTYEISISNQKTEASESVLKTKKLKDNNTT